PARSSSASRAVSRERMRGIDLASLMVKHSIVSLSKGVNRERQHFGIAILRRVGYNRMLNLNSLLQGQAEKGGESMARIKRVAALQDLSCFGRCSLAVVLPVLSAMGVQGCPMPTAVL